MVLQVSARFVELSRTALSKNQGASAAKYMRKLKFYFLSLYIIRYVRVAYIIFIYTYYRHNGFLVCLLEKPFRKSIISDISSCQLPLREVSPLLDKVERKSDFVISRLAC